MVSDEQAMLESEGKRHMLTRPPITEELLLQIRHTMIENPDWGRKRISIHLCELWDWRVPGGTVKDISCRDMLRALDKAGHITLPAPKNTNGQSARKKPARLDHDMTEIIDVLRNLRPLDVEVIERGDALVEFKSLIDQYHYLGFGRTVGENMKYMVRSKDGTPLACLLFGSAAWSCRGRDEHIGWSREQRIGRLSMLTNNTRFLVLPNVKVPHLASHVLSLITRRISADRKQKYGHPILLLETFVDGRFHGTCYKAANWARVGRTAGRGRDDRHHERALPEKEIYVYPLAANFRESLTTQERHGE